jgi:hypothetical protein
LCVLAACGDSHKAKPDAPVDVADVDVPVDANPLDDLLGTGLCADKACTTINSGIMAYTPQYALWADAASKRRWIYLPPGTQIDTTDPDHWLFPTGTKIWKEFTTDTGTRVETRFIWHMGAGNAATDWYYVPYQWNATNDDAVAVPTGVANANGTTHDIPSRNQCKACHDNFQPSRVLGFSAIELDAAPASGEIGLDDLVTMGKLTANPPGVASPHYPLPTDGTTGSVQALGYMHANCGHCHNPNSNVYMFNFVTMQLRLTVGNLGSVTTTEPYTTAVDKDTTQSTSVSRCDSNSVTPNVTCSSNTICQDSSHLTGMCVPDTKIIVSRDPVHSVMIDRFESTNAAIWMPQLGHKTMDPTGDTILTTWITNLP